MNVRPYTAILWKETRTLGSLWIAFLILAGLIGAVVLTTMRREANVWIQFINLLAAVPAFYATGCAATLYAGEKEAKSDLFLGTLPFSVRQLFVGKLAFALFSSIALAGIIAVSIIFTIAQASSSIAAKLPSGEQQRQIWAAWMVFATVGLSAGLLASLYTKRAVIAICLGIAIASTVIHLLTWTSTPALLGGKETNLLVLLPAVFVAALLLYLDSVLVKTWLVERQSRSRARPSHTRSIQSPATMAWPRFRVLGRMLWLSWRENRKIALAMLISFLVVSFWLTLTFGASGYARLMSAFQFVIGAAFLGTAALQGNPAFLIQRGVSATSYWLSRQAIWLCFLAAAALPLIFHYWPRGRYGDPSFPYPGTQTEYVVDWWLNLLITGYAMGQLSSLTVRNSLVAAVVGIALAWPVVTWADVMADVRLSFFLTLLPVAIGFLMLTIIGTRWLLDDRLSRTRVSTVFAIAFVLIIGQVAAVRAVRIHTIDNVTVDPALLTTAPAAPAEIRAAELYRQALYGLTELPPNSSADSSSHLMELTPAREEWLSQHREELRLAIEASRGPVADFEIKPDSPPELPGQHWLFALLELSGRTAEARGDLAEALDSYWALLHLGASVQYKRPAWHWMNDAYLPRALELIMRWADSPGQKSERLHHAIELLGRVPTLYEAPSQAVSTRYQHVLERLKTDEFEADSTKGSYGLIMNLVGESERARRAVNVIAQEDVERAKTLEMWLENKTGGYELTDSNEVSRPHFLLETTPSIRYSYQRFSSNRFLDRELWVRAATLVLALQAWKAEHGEFPEELTSLVPGYVPVLPVDPYSDDNFEYYPKGFPVPLSRTDFSGTQSILVPENVPFIWAASAGVTRVANPEPDKSKYLVKTYRFDYWERRQVREWESADEYTALIHGQIFPLRRSDDTRE